MFKLFPLYFLIIMNSFIERKIIALLNQADTISASTSPINDSEEKCEAIIDQIDRMLSTRQANFTNDFSLETLVRIPETALKFSKKRNIAEKYLKNFLRNIKNEGLFHIKTHVLFAQLLSQKANSIHLRSELKIQFIKDAIQHVSQAIQTITFERSRKKYAFMVYNISKVIYQIIRVYFRPGHLKEFTEIVQTINQTLNSQLDDEYDWKGFFSWLLFYCLEDSKLQKNDSGAILEKLWESSKQNPYFFHEALFRLRIYTSGNSTNVWQAISKEAEKDPSGELKIIFCLQSIKSKIIPENQIDKELNSLMRILLPNKNAETPKSVPSSSNDLLTEIAHIAAQNGIIEVAEKILDVIKKKQQLSSKAFVLMEFARAEMLIHKKKEENIGNKDQADFAINREDDIESRREALHITTKAIKARIGYINPLFVYEGCVKIWNFSLPFLNERYKSEVLKPFITATKVLEDIQSSDFHLRIRMHYELAKILLENNNIFAAEENAKKCQKLFNFCENAFDNKKIELLIEKINIESKPLDSSTKTLLNSVEEKLQTIQNNKLEEFGSIFAEIQEQLSEFNMENLDFLDTLMQNNSKLKNSYIEKMTEEEHENEKKSIAKNLFYQTMVRKYSVYEQASKLSFEKGLYDQCLNLINDALNSIENYIKQYFKEQEKENSDGNMIHVFKELGFDIKTDQNIQISIVKIFYIKAQTLIKKLSEDNIEFALEENVKINPNQSTGKLSAEEYSKMKIDIIQCFMKGAEISLELKQTWLIFNAGILIWNTYLPIFKNVQNNHTLHSMTVDLLECYFNTLKNAISLIENRRIVDYDFENKIQVYGNISIIYTRLLEQKNEFSKVYSVTDDLLLVSLTPQTRKIVNSIRARVGILLKPETKGKKPVASLTNQSDQSIFDINSKLEIITNHFHGNTKQEERLQAIQDCFDLLLDFREKQKDDLDVELLCELWTRLANLALNEEKMEYKKLALSSLKFALEKSDEKASPNFSKYIALAKFLYAKALCSVAELPGIEKEQQEIILMKSLQMILESIDLCIKIKNNKIFEQIKKFYLIIKIISEFFYTPENRRCIIKPIFSLIYYVKVAKETFETFTKDTELSQILINMAIFTSRGCVDKEDWELAHMISNLLLEICLPIYKDRIWTLKTISLTKKGLEIEKIFEEIKNCNATLQCTLCQEIAWNAESVQIQYLAFTRAIDIVKKENSPRIFEIVLNFKEWMFRNDFPIENIKQSLLFMEKLIHIKTIDRQNSSEINLTGDSAQDSSMQVTPKHDSLNQINFEQNSPKEMEIFDYFNSGKSCFSFSKQFLGLVNYSVEDCDNLFKVYYISSILAQKMQEKSAYISNSIFFIWKTFYAIFEQCLKMNLFINPENSEQGETQMSAVDLMPQNWKGWLELELPEKYLENISKTISKQRFCKEAYKQPLVTFHYLYLIFENAIEYGNFSQIAILIKFIEIFASKILENPLVVQFANLQKACMYHISGDKAKAREYIALFQSVVPMTAEYFKKETLKFERTYSDAYSKNFQLNPVNSKTKQTHFLNLYYDFEFWIMYAEIFIFMKEYKLCQTFLEYSMPCCIKVSASELVGKCQIMQGRILSHEGNLLQAQNMFEQAGKNIKLLKNWKNFLLYTTNHFISAGDISNPWKIVEQFEELLNQMIPKEYFQYNKLQAKDLLGFIQLIKINLHTEEFKDFEKNMIIETEECYCENFIKIMFEFVNLFQSFLKTSDHSLLLSSVSYCIEIFGKFLKIIDRIKVLNYEFMNKIYIFLVLILNIFEDLISDLQKLKSDSDVVNPQNMKNSDFFYIFECLHDIILLRCQYINSILGFEEMYRKNGYNFPTIKERYMEEKYFEKARKLKLIEEFEQSNENVVDDYVDIFEYKLNQNVRRSWALIFSNSLNLRNLLNIFEGENICKWIQIELDYTLIFRKEYWRELDLTKQKIVQNLEIIFEQENENLESGNKLAELWEIIDNKYENVEFEDFFNESYFRFHKMKHQKSILYGKDVEIPRLLGDLIEFQSFTAQETLFNYYTENVEKNDTIRQKLLSLMSSRKAEEVKTFISNNQHLQIMFRNMNFRENIGQLPKNSFYVIIEPSSCFSYVFCGIFYIPENGSETCQKFITLKNKPTVLSSLKTLITNYEKLVLEFENNDSSEINLLEKLKKEFSNAQQSFLDLLDIFNEVFTLTLEKVKSENASKKQNDKNKANIDGPIKYFNGLFFLINPEFFWVPFEIIFKEFVSEFQFISKDISINNLLYKTTNPNKQNGLNFNEGFYLANDQINTKIFEELTKISREIAQLFPDGFDFDQKFIPDVSELQLAFEKKKICFFKGCTNFLNVIAPDELFPILKKPKIELFVCFEKIRLFSPEFKKYKNRIKPFSNFINHRETILLLSLMNVKCILLPKTFLMPEDVQQVVQAFSKKIESGGDLSSLMSLPEIESNFALIGNPLIALTKENKPKGK